METFVYPPLPIPIGDVWQKVVVGAKKKEKIKHMNDIFHNFCLPPFANPHWEVWRMVEVGWLVPKKIKHLNDRFHNFCFSPFVNLRGLADGRGWCQINVNEELLAPTWIPQTPNVAPD